MSVAHLNSPTADSSLHRPALKTPWMAAAEIALVFGIFALQAGWPPPDPNEAHYLGKARHFWNETWVGDDFFFNSDDTHLVFYVSLGWLSRWLSLEGFAWAGRLCTWLLLAWSWRRLSWTIVPRPGWSVLSAAIFLTLNVCCHMAGEWVVGGFEAKGLAYALVFLALAEILRGRWNRGWMLLGAASSLHVLVGGWSTVAATVCWLTLDQRPPLRSMLAGLGIGLLLALPGIVAGLAIHRGVTAEVVVEANSIYVFRRLRHHLVPQYFASWYLLRHLLMFLLWLSLCRMTASDPAQRRLRGFVAGAVGIAGAGMILSIVLEDQPTMAAGLLRFYWFRLSDSFLPVGVALTGIAHASGRSRAAPAWIALWLGACVLLSAANRRDYAAAEAFAGPPRADKPGKVQDHADWRAACAWIAAETSADARFITPRMAQTFKWYAGRSEVVSWKDIPQDAEAIVQWWDRLKAIHSKPLAIDGNAWHDSLTEVQPGRLRRLGKRYGADYLITEAQPRLDLRRLYFNDSYAVYRLDAPSPP